MKQHIFMKCDWYKFVQLKVHVYLWNVTDVIRIDTLPRAYTLIYAGLAQAQLNYNNI